MLYFSLGIASWLPYYTYNFNLVCSIPPCRFIFIVFLSLYRKPWINWTNAILRLLDKYLGPDLVLGVGFPLRIDWYFFWHLIKLWIFPYQWLRIELIILDEYWFTKTKLALACPRKASFFIIRIDNLQRNSFSFLNKYLSTV